MRGGNVLTDTLVLSDADRVALRLRSLWDLRRAVIVQGASMVFAALLCWIGFGGQAGASALAGAAAYWLPNTLLALRLMLGIWMRRPLSPLAFLLGEMLKLGLVVRLAGLAGGAVRAAVRAQGVCAGVAAGQIGIGNAVFKKTLTQKEEQGQHGSRQ